MKHPVLDRILMFITALVALCGAALLIALGTHYLMIETVVSYIFKVNLANMYIRIAVIAAGVLLVLFALAMISAMFPPKKKRSSNFAIQHNENGMVRISLKAIETLVHKCLDSHAELKVVTSSLFSDEETVRIDVHVNLQTDISMPLAISALQKQIKKYIEACSGVTVQEVRVFVDGTMPSTPEAANSPYAIPPALMGMETEPLPAGAAAAESAKQEEIVEPAEPVIEAETVCEPVVQEAEEAWEETETTQETGEEE